MWFQEPKIDQSVEQSRNHIIAKSDEPEVSIEDIVSHLLL